MSIQATITTTTKTYYKRHSVVSLIHYNSLSPSEALHSCPPKQHCLYIKEKFRWWFSTEYLQQVWLCSPHVKSGVFFSTSLCSLSAVPFVMIHLQTFSLQPSILKLSNPLAFIKHPYLFRKLQ